MFVKLDPDKMHTMDGCALIVAACDMLSAAGTKNYIYWDDEISVSIGDTLHDVVVDYADCGVNFVNHDRDTCN